MMRMVARRNPATSDEPMQQISLTPPKRTTPTDARCSECRPQLGNSSKRRLQSRSLMPRGAAGDEPTACRLRTSRSARNWTRHFVRRSPRTVKMVTAHSPACKPSYWTPGDPCRPRSSRTKPAGLPRKRLLRPPLKLCGSWGTPMPTSRRSGGSGSWATSTKTSNLSSRNPSVSPLPLPTCLGRTSRSPPKST